MLNKPSSTAFSPTTLRLHGQRHDQEDDQRAARVPSPEAVASLLLVPCFF